MSWAVASMLALAIAAGLFLSAFFSGTETGLYRVNRLRLHLGVQRRDPRALCVSRVLDDEQGALSVTLIGTNLGDYIVTACVAYLFAELIGFGEADAELYTVIIVTPVLFVFTNVVPKSLFRLHADALMAQSGGLLFLFDRLFRLAGAVWLVKQLVSAVARLSGGRLQRDGAFGPKRRVAMLLQEALIGDQQGEEQSDLVDRVCQLSEKPVHSVMVPRNRVSIVSADTDAEGLLHIARRTPFTRLPVYERTRRRIIGIINADELLQSEDWETVGERSRPAVTIGRQETVAAAITRLQRVGRQMAVVADHRGEMLGIVTLNELLSEIVGEVAADV